MISFIISQILGGIALILVCISYFFNKKTFLVFQILSNIFYGAGFVVSSALVTGINVFISTILVIISFVYEEKNKKVPLYYIFIFSVLYIAVGIIFFNDFWDIITIISSIIFTVAVTVENMLTVKYMMMAQNILLMIFGIFNGFYTSAVMDASEMFIIIVSIIEHHIKNIRQKKSIKEYKEEFKHRTLNKENNELHIHRGVK